MNTRMIAMIVGVVLVLGGGYVLLEGGAITSRETVLDVGPLSVSAEERHPIPSWLAGIGIAVGAVLLIGGFTRAR
jgi:hypothetical protein